MEVVTSHTNADFDTFASMIAAKKLYPDAHLVFSGSLEKGLKRALEAIKSPYAFERGRDIDLDKITRLILVDCRQAGRIGPFSSIIGRPGLDIHIYDHHPKTEEDVRGSIEVTGSYGSTTTILTLLIRDRNISLTGEEATLLMAGIYEDTGSLSYPSTTTKDFEAASFLLSSGADLAVASDMLRKELTPDEVSLLNEFLHSQTRYVIDGIEAVVVEGYLEKYGGDIATLAHKIRDIEGMDSLFMLVDSKDRVYLIARSSAKEVDVGKIAREMGGGGHAHAASATIKSMTLVQAKEKLLSVIRKNVVPKKTAKDIMSSPPITAPAEMSLEDAVVLMRRYNINAAPVVKKGEFAGVITRQVADKAVYHGLGLEPVSEYMTTECECVTEETSTEEIREKVISHGQRLIPVIKNRKVTGVITRTDLLKLLQQQLIEAPGTEEKAKSIARHMKESLPGWVMEILKDMGAVAEELGFKAYAVGGFVRDLLLRRENLDIDIVIEGGDGIEFAGNYAARHGLKVKAHHRFRTAVLIFPDGFKIDVATARLEYYEKPGALPTVERSSLKLDLYRRDFIINTLAVNLNPGKFGGLIDFFGAQRDIKDKTVRVLHNLSFVEDPTRMLRAVRFAEKFGFKIGEHTLNLIKNSVRLDMLKQISGPRLLEELKNILEEETASKAIKRLNELGLLRLIHGGIDWDVDRELFFERTRETLIWHELLYTRDKVEAWPVLFLALTDNLTEEEFLSLIKRLSISGKKRLEMLTARAEALKALGRIKPGIKNSGLYSLLKPLPLGMILYLMAKAPRDAVKKMLSNYITRLKDTETVLRGEDLKRLGVATGPLMGDILRLLLAKRLDGEIDSREGEEMLVRRYLKDLKNKKVSIQKKGIKSKA